MFIEPMLRYLLIPFIILIGSLVLPLILRFYRKRTKKQIKQKKSELEDIKQTRVSLQNRVNSEDLTDSEKETTKEALVENLESEAKARFKLLTQKASLAFTNFLTWLARLVSILMFSFGWTFTVAMVGASTAVIYVAVMATVDCNADGTVKQHQTKEKENTSETGNYKGGEGELPKAEGIKPHVEEFRQIIYKKFGITDIGGYRAGDPQDHGQGLALDVMVPEGSKLGDDVAQFAIDNKEAAGITYIIWKQRFYMGVDNKYGAANTWNKMEDRGSKTENHFDHVHISFGASKGSGEIKGLGSSSKSSDSSKKSVDSSLYGFGELNDEITTWAKSYSGFTFIGDSLGVGVESKLKSYFPNSIFDSTVSRAFENSNSTLSGIETAKKLESEKKVKDVVVIALGTNQMPTPLLMDSMVDALPSAKKILWVTTASQGGGSYNKVEHDKIAEVIKSYVSSRSNMGYLDWNRYVEEKSNWSELTSDSVHMNDKGYDLYSKFLTRGIYDYVEGGSSSSEDNLLTKALKKIKCKPKQHKHGTSTKSSPSGLSSVDGQDNPPSDAFNSWGWRPEDLPEGLKPYIIDPKNYGMDFGLPGSGWFQTSDPELNGQCVALTISLGNHIWGRPQENVLGNGHAQASAWANIFGNSVTTTPKRGAIFSSWEHSEYGHTGIVCTVFKDGSLLTVEQNTSLAGWNSRGEQYVWFYRIYRKEQWKSVGMTFAYDDKKAPVLK